MKKCFCLFIFLSFFSCKKDEKENLVQTKRQEIPSLISSNLLAIDTVFFLDNTKTRLEDYALVHLQSKTYGRDSICSAKFLLEFYQKNKMIYSTPLFIKGIDKESEWYGQLELDSVASPLRTITLGYPACGYIHDNFLYYIKEKQSQFLFHWNSMSDGEWGSWGEITSGTAEDFYYRHITFGGGEEDDNNESIGIAEYSDSIHFKKANNHWTIKYLTPKDKVYRQKKQSYTEFNSGK
jgi:hypothetical protein